MSTWLRTPFSVSERRVEGGVALFHCGSAETLLLDEGSALVFSLLDTTPRSDTELSTVLVLQSDLAPAEAIDYVVNALVRLASLNLAIRQEP